MTMLHSCICADEGGEQWALLLTPPTSTATTTTTSTAGVFVSFSWFQQQARLFFLCPDRERQRRDWWRIRSVALVMVGVLVLVMTMGGETVSVTTVFPEDRAAMTGIANRRTATMINVPNLAQQKTRRALASSKTMSTASVSATTATSIINFESVKIILLVGDDNVQGYASLDQLYQLATTNSPPYGYSSLLIENGDVQEQQQPSPVNGDTTNTTASPPSWKPVMYDNVMVAFTNPDHNHNNDENSNANTIDDVELQFGMLSVPTSVVSSSSSSSSSGTTIHNNTFGPELSLGRTVAQIWSEDFVVIIKCTGHALSGPFLSPTGAAANYNPNNNNQQQQQQQRVGSDWLRMWKLVEQVEQQLPDMVYMAMQVHASNNINNPDSSQPRLKKPSHNDLAIEYLGLIWWHGYSDWLKQTFADATSSKTGDPSTIQPTEYGTYARQLQLWLDDVRSHLNDPVFPILVGELGGQGVLVQDYNASVERPGLPLSSMSLSAIASNSSHSNIENINNNVSQSNASSLPSVEEQVNTLASWQRAEYDFRQMQQKAVATSTNFYRTQFVETAKYVPASVVSNNNTTSTTTTSVADMPFVHYYARADTMMEIGQAFALTLGQMTLLFDTGPEQITDQADRLTHMFDIRFEFHILILILGSFLIMSFCSYIVRFRRGRLSAATSLTPSRGALGSLWMSVTGFRPVPVAGTAALNRHEHAPEILYRDNDDDDDHDHDSNNNKNNSKKVEMELTPRNGVRSRNGHEIISAELDADPGSLEDRDLV